MKERIEANNWWDNLTLAEQIAIERKHGYYGHDIGTTEEDVISMYRLEFKL